MDYTNNNLVALWALTKKLKFVVSSNWFLILLLQHFAKSAHMSWQESRMFVQVFLCWVISLTPTWYVFSMVVHASHPYMCCSRAGEGHFVNLTPDVQQTQILCAFFIAHYHRGHLLIFELNVIARKWYAVGSFRANIHPWGWIHLFVIFNPSRIENQKSSI